MANDLNGFNKITGQCPFQWNELKEQKAKKTANQPKCFLCN